MKIFLYYGSEQSELAKEIALALRQKNHTVFFDRSALAPADAYNAEIREAIEDVFWVGGDQDVWLAPITQRLLLHCVRRAREP